MVIERKATVGAIAAAMPDALPVFQRLGIDFCCGGKKPLQDALAEKHLDEEQFFGLVEEERANRNSSAQPADFTDMSPAVLTAYIEDTHHDYLRRTLPEIDKLLLAVLRAHGKNHGELFEAYRLFGRLKTELEQHLIREETMLFPALAQAEAQERNIMTLATEIIKEHEGAGILLEQLHRVTGDFTLPADACQSYRRVYALLPELENDLHRHIHLENNILLENLDMRRKEEAGDER